VVPNSPGGFNRATLSVSTARNSIARASGFSAPRPVSRRSTVGRSISGLRSNRPRSPKLSSARLVSRWNSGSLSVIR
jgi:hypothetical protein